MPEAKPAMLEEFDDVILTLAAKQQSQTEQEQPTHKFLRKLKSLIDSGAALAVYEKLIKLSNALA